MNVLQKSQKYYINRIRLINFHNFTDEAVDIKDGGHLFILGDNGSGKTTLLDAVHYVLTAGESLELNSAARIAGSKAEGRRVQDIITRYNIDSGHLNPNGAITYAALELKSFNNKPIVAAIGMMVNSPTDNLNRWGIIKSGVLEDIPFICDTLEGSRPRTGQEMKKEIGSNNCFLQLQRYKNVLADRLFGSLEQFAEFCRFLKICKAYREIASQTTDYHELFKKLLPTPGVERFERVIESLNKLDSSRIEIDALIGKRDYVSFLTQLLNDLKYKKKLIGALECMKLEFNINDIKDSIELKKRESSALKKNLSDLSVSIESLSRDKSACEEQLDDYKQRDSSGIVRQESELNKRIEELSVSVKKLEDDLSNKFQQQQLISEKLKSISDNVFLELKKTFVLLSEISQNIPFSIGELIAITDKCLHEKEPCVIIEILSKLDFLPYNDLLMKHNTQIAIELNESNGILESVKTQIRELEEELENLESTEEAIPYVDNFSDAIETLRADMIKYKPLYLGLEWNAGITKSEIDFIEEFIGEDILASIIIKNRQFEDASQLILNDDFTGIRLVSEELLLETKIDTPAWIKKYFSLKNSDPLCLVALIYEFYSEREPTFDFENEILGFRSHKRHLVGKEAFLIGEKNRKNKIKNKIKELKAELKDLKSDLDHAEQEHKKVKLRKKNLNNLESILKRCESFFTKNINDYINIQLELKHCNEIISDRNIQIESNNKTLQSSQNRLIEIRKIISSEGLENLDEKISAVTLQIKSLDGQIGSGKVECGKIEERLKVIQFFIEEKSENLVNNESLFNEKSDQFKSANEEIGNVVEYLKELRHQEKIGSLIKCSGLINKYSDERIILTTRLHERIRDKELGMQYNFTYYDEDNMLVDRQGRSVYDIHKQYELDIKDMQEVINEKTSELFKKIIMDDLVRFLKERINHVEEMEKNVNEILKRRQFGNNQYYLKIRPADKYKNLVKIIKTYSPLNSETEKELKDFFEYYRLDIVDTEPGEIPEMLDYRNWYGYEMLVKTSDSEGKVLNKYVKNIGSGGEQAVPNYLLVLTIAHFIYQGSSIKLPVLLFDEAFYGIDAGRRDQLMGFAGDIGLQVVIATPDQDGVRQEIMYSTSLFIRKDKDYNIKIQPVYWTNPDGDKQEKFEFIDKNEGMQIGSVQ